jgi:hypothetical protein
MLRESVRAGRKCASKFSGVQGFAHWGVRIRGAVPVVSLPEISVISYATMEKRALFICSHAGREA